MHSTFLRVYTPIDPAVSLCINITVPLTGNRLELLWALIRHKLASASREWHSSDISAMLMIKPWVRIFSPGHMEAFMSKNIVPKLALCLSELVINPANQNMGE